MDDNKAQADAIETNKQYRYWRTRILYSSLIGYALFYFVRKNISMALPGIEDEFGITKATLGLFLTLHGLLYGISKLVNGIWGDRANPRYFMAMGLFLSALMSIFFGMSSTVLAFGIFWLLNGWFQGMGCPASVKCLCNWFTPSERGLKFAIWNTSHSIGAALVLFLNSFLVIYDWRLCFFVPAGIAIAGVIFLLNRLRDTPESLGLPSVEDHFNHEVEVKHDKERKMSSAEFRSFLVKYVFKNPGIWVISFASFFLYIVRYAILDWGPTFLSEMKGAPLRHAGIIIAVYEVSGIVGMLVAGWMMDKLFKGRGSKVCVIYMLTCVVFTFLFWKLPIKSNIGNAILLCGIGFTIYGPQCLLGPIVANMATKKAAATAVGLVGFFSYLSVVFSGWGLGYIVDHYNWGIGFFTLIIAGLLAASMFGITSIWNFQHRV